MARGRPAKIIPFPADQADAIKGVPPCPKDLDEVARKKWKLLTKELQAAGLVTKLDGDTMRDYCLAFSEELAARKQLAQMPNQFLVAGEHGGISINPLRRVVRDAREEMRKLREQLGLAPLARQRLKPNGTARKPIATRDRSKGPPPPAGRIG